jgi:hypothetical protein
MVRVAVTWKGMISDRPVWASIRRIFPPAQYTMDRLSGVHAIEG